MAKKGQGTKEPAETAAGSREYNQNTSEQGKKSMKGIIIGVLLFLVIAGLGAALFFDLFSLRSRFVIPALSRIPLVGNLIPESENADIDSTGDDIDYTKLSKNQLIQEIKKLEQQLEDKTEQSSSQNGYIEERIKDLDRLAALEEQHAQFAQERTAFEQDRLAFEQSVVLADADAYMKYYQGIEPERAAQLYQSAAAQVDNIKEVKKYAATFSSMNADNAAAVIEDLMRSEIDLVVLIMQNIDTERRGKIFDAMKPRNVSAITKRLIPN